MRHGFEKQQVMHRYPSRDSAFSVVPHNKLIFPKFVGKLDNATRSSSSRASGMAQEEQCSLQVTARGVVNHGVPSRNWLQAIHVAHGHRQFESGMRQTCV